jgi:hypothetical protein
MSDEIFITGKTYNPVIWNLRIYVTKEDIPSLLKILSDDDVIATVKDWLKGLSGEEVPKCAEAFQMLGSKLPEWSGIFTNRLVFKSVMHGLLHRFWRWLTRKKESQS